MVHGDLAGRALAEHRRGVAVAGVAACVFAAAGVAAWLESIGAQRCAAAAAKLGIRASGLKTGFATSPMRR